jgi:hypothetical protein
MQGLKERNQNIIRSSSKRSDKKGKPVLMTSHASSHNRTPPKKHMEEVLESRQSDRKGNLDEEEMLFLARRCLAEELMIRPNVPSILTEMAASQSAAATSPISMHPGFVPSMQASPIHQAPAIVAPVTRAIPLRRNSLFQLNRLGVGLVVIRFGWIWVSCGGLILADSVFCTGDIFKLVFKRLGQHFTQVGSRLGDAAKDTVRLFVEEQN